MLVTTPLGLEESSVVLVDTDVKEIFNRGVTVTAMIKNTITFE